MVSHRLLRIFNHIVKVLELLIQPFEPRQYRIAVLKEQIGKQQNEQLCIENEPGLECNGPGLATDTAAH